jgi:hypothetical protein
LSASQLAYIAGARPAYDPGNGALVAGGAVPAGPGMPYEEPVELTPGFCTEMKDDGNQCGARPVKGEARCIGHKRSLEG